MQITGGHASAIDAIIPDGYIADDLAGALAGVGVNAGTYRDVGRRCRAGPDARRWR
jgi:hypothetical protein